MSLTPAACRVTLGPKGWPRGSLGYGSLPSLTASSGYDYLPRPVAAMVSTQSRRASSTESSHSGDAKDPDPRSRGLTSQLGVWQIGLFALPLLMTGEKVRDIGVGAGVRQWPSRR